MNRTDAIALLKSDVAEFNRYREKHPNWVPDLTRARLTEANLTDANLTRANLTDANLTCANLTRARLTDADLTRARLTDADLTRANLDFSSWPLRCGSLDVTCDVRLARQLAYHLCRLKCDDPEFVKIVKKLKSFANKFHRVDQCGRIE